MSIYKYVFLGIALFIYGPLWAACEAPAKCQALGSTAGAALLSGMTSTANQTANVPAQAGSLAGTTNSCGANFTAASAKCGSLKSECASCGSQKTSCEKQIDGMIGQYQAQALSCGQNAQAATNTQTASNATGNLSALSNLLTTAAAGAMAYMLANKNASEDETAASTDTALTTAGLDCSKSDSYRYVACDTQLSTSCSPTTSTTTTTATGVTTVSTANLIPGSLLCQNFAARYCAGTTAAGTNVTLDGATYYEVDTAGSGLGGTFCQTTIAYSYCISGGTYISGRETCPSCQKLQALTAAACVQDPSLCLAQNSSSSYDQAKLTCPTDPYFSSAEYINSSAAANTGSAVVVLPQSVGEQPSDIGSRYGPSVFSISQTAIQSRCEQGKLNCGI